TRTAWFSFSVLPLPPPDTVMALSARYTPPFPFTNTLLYSPPSLSSPPQADPGMGSPSQSNPTPNTRLNPVPPNPRQIDFRLPHLAVAAHRPVAERKDKIDFTLHHNVLCMTLHLSKLV
ncbi:hypothetical protein NQZ68_025817, partial [Dissostichus eleginoides]